MQEQNACHVIFYAKMAVKWVNWREFGAFRHVLQPE